MSHDLSQGNAERPPGGYGTTREAFVTQAPEFLPWVQASEALHGLLLRVVMVRFKDGRALMVARFTTAWYVCFRNPANDPPENVMECFLSREMLYALWGCCHALQDATSYEESWQRFVDAVELPPATEEAPDAQRRV